MIDLTRAIIVVLSCLLFAGCSMNPRDLTVADIERKSRVIEQPAAAQKEQKTEVDVDIYQAYTSYVQQVEKDDHFRAIAISRLADLELEAEQSKISLDDLALNKEIIEARKEEQNRSRLERNFQELEAELSEESTGVASSEELREAKKEQQNHSRLERILELLEMSLRDYPDIGNNDEVLYRLAMIASQLGQHEKAVDALGQLVNDYPESRFYLETQFRLAEDFFVVGDYEAAEQRYSQVIDTPDNKIFIEKAYFKRGWAKFKLQAYRAAVDDLMIAVAFRDSESRKLQKKDAQGVRGGVVLDEHFRAYFYAIALNFLYLEDNRALVKYFRGTRSSRFAYHVYAGLSDIYLEQKRYTDVVTVLKQFIARYPASYYLPSMELQVVTTWERSGFFDNFYAAADRFYKRYHPEASYWKGKQRSMLSVIKPQLRDNIFSLASHFHNQYQRTATQKSLALASQWYERYLLHYADHAMKDNVFYAYADLLTEDGKYEKAIGFYERVAYRRGAIVDQRAAYATIVLSERLHAAATGRKLVKWQVKYIKHALLFKRTYPDDMRSERIVLRAAEMSFASGQYQQAANLASLLERVQSKERRLEANQIKAESYFNLSNFRQAETAYLYLIRSLTVGDARKKKMEDRLALTIYKQAEKDRAAGNLASARQNFERIAALAGKSEIAPKGLYDALTLAMESETWLEAIDYGGRFRSQYPQHERRDDVIKLLSVAYINAGQSHNAAQILEEIYNMEQDSEVKMAALWQSAELYESLNDLPAAVRTYQRYVENFQEPFPQYLEALNKLTTMNDAMGETRLGDLWAGKIRKADLQASANAKTDRTNHIAAVAKIRLAREKKAGFDQLKIRQPLKVHLKKKKDAMDWARKLYTAAYEYRSPEVMSESLFSIAEMYYGFSQDVLSSTRPAGLNEEEMEQYEIGLEDLAFPVEEKAIEIYESNLAHINQGLFNGWTKKSFNRLKKIFPVRYARKVKVDEYVDYAH